MANGTSSQEAQNRVWEQMKTKTSPVHHSETVQGYLNDMNRGHGAGGFWNQYQNFFTRIDRYQHNILPTNSEHSGLTFITRPRLCLRSQNVRGIRTMAPLDTGDITSVAYMIKCLLDTKYCQDHIEIVHQSPLVEPRNPFLIPVCNALTGISGFPDIQLNTFTTEGGFFSEDQTFVIGYDQLNRTYDLSLSFKDIQNGPIAALFHYWNEYMGRVMLGDMVAYADDIDNQRINYTVSIYRFNTDPTRRYITKYAKATGCFPRATPLGGMINVNEFEPFISTAGRFTIPFVANKIEYNDPIILMEFNMLMRRYCRGIDHAMEIPLSPTVNYNGLPFIKTGEKGMEFVFVDPDTISADARRDSRAEHDAKVAEIKKWSGRLGLTSMIGLGGLGGAMALAYSWLYNERRLPSSVTNI